MEKEFVPYEIALELKELGFDEPCIRGWDKNGKIWYHPDSDIILDNPTFSQAFRWFRENYKLCGLIEIGTQEFSYQVFNNKGNRQLGTEPLIYNGTYEAAELECLKKLIELTK